MIPKFMTAVFKSHEDEVDDDDDGHDDDDDDVDDGFWKQNTNLLSKGIISASKSYDFFFSRK